MKMRPVDLLEAFSSKGKRVAPPSTSRPHRLAIIDPAYDPTTYPVTLPRVTYEGESTLAERRLAVLGSYIPIPGHRVMLAPIGTTYAIVGPVSPPRPAQSLNTNPHLAIGTAEGTSLVIGDYFFAPRTAYEVVFKGLAYGTAGAQMHFRLRKTGPAGADWGEYGRVRVEGTAATQAAIGYGSLILLRSPATSLTAHVALTVAMSSGTGTIHASTTSPRWMLIRPIGPAALYAGMGVEVT